MSQAKNSYRQIMKGTSIFGGVQLVNIIISIVKSKIVAILLGPAGIGIAGLLTSSTSLVKGLTNFGLGTSAVRNISEANAAGEQGRVSRIITVLRRLVWLTGMLGCVLTFTFASYISHLTFGNTEYIIAFRWLSVTLLIDQLTAGQRVLLQGLRQLKYLAKANVLGSLVGLLISVPLFYFYKIDGIVPSIIGSSVVAMVISWYFSKKLVMDFIPVSTEETVREGRSMVTLGFMLSLSGLISVGASYIIKAYISQTGSIDDVGLYTAGFAIIGSYVGMVFNAMGTDYYPRLASVVKDNKRANELVQQQAEVALLILGPILCIFIIFAHWGVVLLYSNQFTPITDMIRWAALGMYFRAVSWAIAFVFLAKGKSSLFFWNETIANAYILILNLIGYKYYGLTGLGVSYLIAYLLYFLQVYLITQKNYNFRFSSTFYLLIFINLALGVSCFITIYIFPSLISYIIGIILIAIVSFYSFMELNKRLAVVELIKKKFLKKR